MFLKCYQVDSTGRKAIGFNLSTNNCENIQTECWINVDTGIVIRQDYADASKEVLKQSRVFNISNSQGDTGYCQAIIIVPIIKKNFEEIFTKENNVIPEQEQVDIPLQEEKAKKVKKGK